MNKKEWMKTTEDIYNKNKEIIEGLCLNSYANVKLFLRFSE